MIFDSCSSLGSAYDTLKVRLRSIANAILAAVGTYSNLNKGSTYVKRTFDVTAYKGTTVRVDFEGAEDASKKFRATKRFGLNELLGLKDCHSKCDIGG